MLFSLAFPSSLRKLPFIKWVVPQGCWSKNASETQIDTTMTFTVLIVSIEQNEEFQESRVHYTIAGIKSLLKIGEGGFRNPWNPPLWRHTAGGNSALLQHLAQRGLSIFIVALFWENRDKPWPSRRIVAHELAELCLLSHRETKRLWMGWFILGT